MELTEQPRFPSAGRADVSGGLKAPMPGNVTAVHVAEGDAVAAGDLLLVLEAMKMEHRITAPGDGTVRQVLVGAGDQVDNGALLIVLAADEES